MHVSLERAGEADSMMMIGDYMRKKDAGTLDMWSVLGIEGFMLRVSEWHSLGGPGGDFFLI